MRLYCITRKDLKPGQKTAQLCHAATQYLLDHPDTQWNNGFIICLEARDEDHLWEIKKRIRRKRVETLSFPRTRFWKCIDIHISIR